MDEKRILHKLMLTNRFKIRKDFDFIPIAIQELELFNELLFFLLGEFLRSAAPAHIPRNRQI